MHSGAIVLYTSRFLLLLLMAAAFGTVQSGMASCIQDRERGVVWEETIIFLPPASRMVFLSATLSNAGQARMCWLGAVMRLEPIAMQPTPSLLC